MARLDRLGPAKEVAQIGSVIGREFSYALLSAVIPKPNEGLSSALDWIVRAGLLFRQGVPPNASYLFKHALSSTRPTAHSCANRDGHCTRVLPMHLRASSQT